MSSRPISASRLLRSLVGRDRVRIGPNPVDLHAAELPRGPAGNAARRGHAPAAVGEAERKEGSGSETTGRADRVPCLQPGDSTLSELLTTAFVALVIAALATAGLAVAAKPTVVRAGNLVLRLNGGVASKALPKHRLGVEGARDLGQHRQLPRPSPPAAIRRSSTSTTMGRSIDRSACWSAAERRAEVRGTDGAKKSATIATSARERPGQVEFAEQDFVATRPGRGSLQRRSSRCRDHDATDPAPSLCRRRPIAAVGSSASPASASSSDLPRTSGPAHCSCSKITTSSAGAFSSASCKA